MLAISFLSRIGVYPVLIVVYAVILTEVRVLGEEKKKFGIVITSTTNLVYICVACLMFPIPLSCHFPGGRVYEMQSVSKTSPDLRTMIT